MNFFERVVQGFNNLFHRDDRDRLVSPVPERPTQPTATPTPSPKPEKVTPEQIEAGLRKFDASSPLLDYTQQLADAANRMPKGVDRFLPVVMSIMETGGGKKLAAQNNPFNLRGTQAGRTKFIDYPSMDVAILGGDNQGVQSKGFVGTIGEHPAYEKFRQSGSLEDFFNSFTPPGPEYGNPSMDELKQRYNSIRNLFAETEQATSPRVGNPRGQRELERRARLY